MIAESTPSPPSVLNGKRILVVDDDRLNRRLLGAILRPEGCEVIEADTGEKAWSYTRLLPRTWCCSTSCCRG